MDWLGRVMDLLKSITCLRAHRRAAKLVISLPGYVRDYSRCQLFLPQNAAYAEPLEEGRRCPA
jgi:hypothetical protein